MVDAMCHSLGHLEEFDRPPRRPKARVSQKRTASIYWSAGTTPRGQRVVYGVHRLADGDGAPWLIFGSIDDGAGHPIPLTEVCRFARKGDAVAMAFAMQAEADQQLARFYIAGDQ
ncbi:hypothetical protein [Phenylobacterium sp.]|uniref:hypothetical protein n=1 Tax=Phenylobacterium sp. TaxID=1871053 RepID=UPI00374CB678